MRKPHPAVQRALDRLAQRARTTGYVAPPNPLITVGQCLFWGQTIEAHEVSHAHVFFEAICAPRLETVLTPTGRPTKTFAHEYAHLLAPTRTKRYGHGVRWQRAVTALGWPSEARQYQEQP